MMCPLEGRLDAPNKTSSLILTNYAGKQITLHRDANGEEKGEHGKKKTVWRTDWSSCTPCVRCEGYPNKDGGMYGGHLTVYRIHPDGYWLSALTACHCFYGAWWTFDKFDADGRIRTRKVLCADSLRDIPPALTGLDWRWLGLSHEAGDSYLQAAYRLPDADGTSEPAMAILKSINIRSREVSQEMHRERDEAKVRIIQTIEAWEKAGHPKWDPDAGDNRKPEAVDDLPF